MGDGTPTIAMDGFSWRHPLVASIAEDGDKRHFSLATEPRQDGKVARSPLVRSSMLSMYVQTCLNGQGENFVHAHDDESGWLVLEGEAVFYAADGEEMARVRAGEGLTITPGVGYRYVCRGNKTVMVRAAARPRTDADE
jgi:mannose-6-phosphate isomerase-like protein (cupin superfamily)